jgi:hypothetical protein
LGVFAPKRDACLQSGGNAHRKNESITKISMESTDRSHSSCLALTITYITEEGILLRVVCGVRSERELQQFQLFIIFDLEDKRARRESRPSSGSDTYLRI